MAERTGTYTAFDYAAIMEHLIKRWEVASVQGISGEAAEAQEYLVKLPDRWVEVGMGFAGQVSVRTSD